MDPLSHFGKIVGFYHSWARLPSYREIMTITGLKSTHPVHKLVNKLVASGHLCRDDTGRLLPTRHFSDIPWLGTIAAGWPSPAEEELLDTMSLEDYLIPNRTATYMLRASGDSMIDAGIQPGDLVLVERCETARYGDIVVAEVDGEFTLKYLRKRRNRVYLEAANPRYPTIEPKEALHIIAVVVSVCRRYQH